MLLCSCAGLGTPGPKAAPLAQAAPPPALRTASEPPARADLSAAPEALAADESPGKGEADGAGPPRLEKGPAHLGSVALGGGEGREPRALAVAQDKLFVALSDGRVRGIVFVQGGAQRILRGLPLSGEDRAGSARQRGGSAGFAGRGGTGRSPPELVRGIKGRLPAFWIPALPPAVTLATSGDGRSLLVTCPRGTNRVFDVSGAAPRLYRRWERKSGSGEGLTHDGKMLVRGDVRGQVRGYALEEYKLLWLIPAQGVVMSPDGRWALCRKGKTLTIHSGDTGRQVGKTHRASGEILAMATASSELPAWVEKSSGGCSLRVPGGPPRALPCGNKTALSYSPTGDLLAVSLGDRVQLHHGRSGELLAQHQRTGATLTAIPLDSRTYVVAGLEPDRVTWFRLPAP